MILTLEVTSQTGRDLPAQSRVRLQDSGCTIGRATVNSLVLPHRSVSNRHARIVFSNGVFQLEDPGSTNGVFVNSPDNQVPPGTLLLLRSGDVILIDPYELRVVIGETEESARPLPSPVGLEDDADPFQFLSDWDRPQTENILDLANLPPPSPQNEPFKPPSVIVPPPQKETAIPSEYDPVKSVMRKREQEFEPPQPTPRQTAQPSVSPPAAVTPEDTPAVQPTPRRRLPEPAPGNDAGNRAGLDMAAVLAGVGIDAAAMSPDVAHDFGRILRVVVEGVMDLLQSRQKIKEEFRLPTTSFKPRQNNPLKFSANVDDALHNLLVKHNAAYLGPVEAFEDAFSDVRNHQMAVLEGLRVAFEATLRAFDPDALQKEFDKLGKGSLISVPAKLRYWEMYRGKYGDMVSDAEKCFRELFGDQFAKAYEEQLKRLKDQQGSSRPLL